MGDGPLNEGAIRKQVCNSTYHGPSMGPICRQQNQRVLELPTSLALLAQSFRNE